MYALRAGLQDRLISRFGYAGRENRNVCGPASSAQPLQPASWRILFASSAGTFILLT